MLESSLKEKKKTITRHIKITKGKYLIGKGKYTVMVEDQPLIKLIGRLKDKSSNTIYIHNKQLRSKWRVTK